MSQLLSRLRRFARTSAAASIHTASHQPGRHIEAHYALQDELFCELGIGDVLVRLSVAIKGTRGLVPDLSQAIEAALSPG